MINAGTSFIKTSIVCSSTADNFLSYIFTNKSLLQQEFLNCCKKTLLEHLVSKINCTIFALKEFVDPAQSLLPLCSSAGLAQAVVKEFYAKLEHFIDHSNELGCPVPCTTTSYRHDIQYYSRMREMNTYKSGKFELSVYYNNLEIEERTETLIYDLSNFLSAAGGNLGLLMGFSCLSVLLALIKCLTDKWLQ